MKEHQLQWIKKKRKQNEHGGGEGHPPSSTSQVEIQQHSYSIIWSLYDSHITESSSKTHGGKHIPKMSRRNNNSTQFANHV